LTVSATSDGMMIATRESALLRTTLLVNGSLPTADAGQTVDIQMLGARTAWSWEPATQTEVRGNGTYSASWTPRLAGQFAVRALIEQSGASAATNLPSVTVIVYRPAVATLYGPGFYGHRTACGRVLRRRTLGVANRTLRCGTSVAVYYKGRMMVVPVIDRGPYSNGASWDMTMATAKAFGMDTTVTIGAAPLPPSH
jgi:rare lipoprotein A (peptidoglycan hydrolase)